MSATPEEYIKSLHATACAKRDRLTKQIAGLQASLAKTVEEISTLEKSFNVQAPALPVAPLVAMPKPPVWTQGNESLRP